jgi:putative GTP pyrophosphokinase
LLAVPAPAPFPHSKGEINRCGDYLIEVRHVLATTKKPPPDFDQDRWHHAWTVVSDYRSAHSYPLTKVTMGLRSMVSTEVGYIVVSQRLKRMPRLIRKLRRMVGTKLARLEDIGGCRAVLGNGQELQRVHRRLKKRWAGQIVRERDCIAEPKDIGYRAIHLVVLRDERRIEVQLRTTSQQAWADAVERADARLGMTLKDGEGPADMVEFFSAAGEVQHMYDYGTKPPAEALDRLERARRAVIKAGYYSK